MSEAYYIREPDVEEAEGPFPVEHLQSWGEIGRISAETLYYDDELEAWAKIGSNEALKAQIFPVKKKLVLKKMDEPEPEPAPRESAAGESTEPTTAEDEEDAAEKPSVDAMLAAAEGNTEETRYIRQQQQSREKAASLSLPVLATIMAVSALTYIYPSWDIIQLFLEENPDAMGAALQQPLLFLGALDLFFALTLVLGATSVFPLLRFRAMLGSGFFAVTYWTAGLYGDPHGMLVALCLLASGLAVFVITLTLNLRLVLLFACIGLAGIAGFAYFTTFLPLLGG